MENATKGLMIAGAILIAIVLIGIGVFLVGQAQGWIGKAQGNFDEMAASSFNSKFEAYRGSKKGAEIMNLLSQIRTNNLRAERDSVTDDESITVKFDDGTGNKDASSSSEVNALNSLVNTGSTYTVTTSDYSNKNGYVRTITIVKEKPVQ